MIGVCQAFTGVHQGKPLDVTFGGDADMAGDDPRGAYARVTDELMQGWGAPDGLEKSLKMPSGEVPAARGASMLVTDLIIHTWDLARALDRPYAMEEDLATAAHELMTAFLSPGTRGPGKPFAEPVPCAVDAPIQDRLIALSGRRL